MARFADLRAQVKGTQRAEKMTEIDKSARALLVPAMLVAMADGALEVAELSAMTAALEAAPELEDRALSIPELLDGILAEIDLGDTEDLVAEARAALDGAGREDALSLAIRVACADGDFDYDEQGTLLAIATNFGIDRARYTELQEAVIGKLN